MTEKSDPIPREVQTFLADNIASVVELEALLLLYAHRGRAWSAAEIARELRIDAGWALTELQPLCSRRILACAQRGNETTFTYAPELSEMDATIAALARAYNDRRTTIISLIFGKPMEKLKTFADAFRLRKEPPVD